MDEELTATPRPSAPWRALEAIPVAVLALVGAGLVSAGITAALEANATGLLLAGLVFEVALAGTSIAWVHLRYRGALRALGLVSRTPGRDVASGVVWGVALFFGVVVLVAPLVFWLVELFVSGSVQAPRQEVIPADPELAQIALGAFVVIVAAPVGEEIFFRGFLYGALRRRLGFGTAAVVSGAAFGAFHVLPLLMPLMFVVGLGLAAVYERRGTLIASIAAHGAFNVIGYTFIVLALR
ncbi:MAG: lysostaphin resistance A-like protein [Actinomycetota bacterium]